MVSYDEYHGKLMSAMHKKHPFSSSLDIIRLCMEEVENLNLKGDTKSLYVTNAIQRIMQDNLDIVSSAHVAELQFLFSHNMLQSIIDTIIFASKGQLDLNKNKNENTNANHYKLARRNGGTFIWG